MYLNPITPLRGPLPMNRPWVYREPSGNTRQIQRRLLHFTVPPFVPPPENSWLPVLAALAATHTATLKRM